jgi:hypothetical protein
VQANRPNAANLFTRKCSAMKTPKWSRLILFTLLVTLLGNPAASAGAQTWPDTTAGRVRSASLSGAAADRLRTQQLLGERETAGYLLRSLSSLGPQDVAAPARMLWTFFGPDLLLVHNSALPYSYNDGALWAGRGVNVSAMAGVGVRFKMVRLAAVPQITYSANAPYALAAAGVQGPLPATRSPFASPFIAAGNSIDLPIRFGADPLRRVDFGQSGVFVDAHALTFAISAENEWWGPGVRNALLLSDNAGGFPHIEAATNRPVDTRVGRVEGRWLLGGLSESPFFVTNGKQNLRSISMLGVTLQPAWVPELTVGAARAVYGGVGSWGDIPKAALNVFSDVGDPNLPTVSDSIVSRGRDQLMSLFFRWALPKDHFETYGEWGRAQFPTSLRDFLEEPTHSQAYTLGVQWIGGEHWARGRPRIQSEVSFIQQSSTYRFRPIGSWYTSHAVPAGYTNEGQVLGAAIGPGGSSQWVKLGYDAPAWEVGASITRIRWMEDAHAQCAYAPELSLYGYADHDVSFLTGVSGAVKTRFGTLSASVDPGWRLNVFFPLCGRARYPLPDSRDERNRTISVRFSPNFFRARP